MIDAVKQELLKLQKKNGGILEPAKVFEAARPESSPLHGYFQWDVQQAFLEHNLDRARNLIQSFKVVYRDVEVTKQTVKFVEASPLPQWTPHPHLRHGYASTESLLAGPERKDTLFKEHIRCMGHVDRYVSFLRTAGLEKEVEKLNRIMVEIRGAIAGLAQDAVN